MNDTKIQTLLQDFTLFSHQTTENSLKKYLKTKAIKLFGENAQKTESQDAINWKDELIDAYEQMKTFETQKLKLTSLCEELVACLQKCIKSKDIEIQMLTNELSHSKSCLEEERQQNHKLQKDHEHQIEKQKLNTIRALEKLEYKEFELRELEEKICEYEQEIQEIKSTEYQNMINSIKEEEIMNSEAQSLYKENTLLKYQLKEEVGIKNQMSKHVKVLAEEIEIWKDRYYNARRYIAKKIDGKRRKEAGKQQQTSRSVSRIDTKQNHQENTINLIDFRDDFSFKDSIENENPSFIVHNNGPSFLDLESHSDFLYDAEESPDRCLMERDILNLTDRDRSTQSRNITKHLIRSRKRLVAGKQNVSENTWDYQEFEQDNNEHKISTFGSKCQQMAHHNATAGLESISKYDPSPKAFGTQERYSLLSKHRRIKSSFCGKNIKEFQEYENNENHFILNSEKFTESMFEENGRLEMNEGENQKWENNLENESSISGYDVNEIEINEELIVSQKDKLFGKEMNTPEMFGSIEAKMITSVQVTNEEKEGQMTFQKPLHGGQTSQKTNAANITANSSVVSKSAAPLDPYYAFFSLTAQCVKLNSKNFNKAISVYFNLQEQYNNVIRKTIPLNKWYNYINDQIETALKYAC